MPIIILLVYCCLFSNSIFAETLNVNDSFTQGQNLLNQGRYYQAVKALEFAMQQAESIEQKAYATGALGLAHYQLQHDKHAEDLLRLALSYDKANAHEQARWNALLGVLLTSQTEYDEAERYFAKALILAKNDKELSAGIELQQLDLLPLRQRLSKLKQIQSELLSLKPSTVRSHYLVRLATQAQQFGQAEQNLIYESLIAAKASAPPQLQGEILGEIAQLYENAQRYDEALQLNKQALAAITKESAPDLRLELEWRQGRLFRHRNDISEALAAYQRAINHVEIIRHDIPLVYRNGQSSLQTTLTPLYKQMADLLLTQASTQSKADKISMLRRARNVIERIKQTELEDFLGGRCAIHPVRNALLDDIEPKTAILYPIILPDRVELLVSTGNDIQQFSQAIDTKTLQQAVYRFTGALRSGQPNAKILSLPLYQWLIAPLESHLQHHNIQTLVVVPDGVLRLVPFAALFDGKGYLIERYALSASPGLSIIEPAPLQTQSVNSLVVGLSEPGGVIDHLPDTMLKQIETSSVRGLATTPMARSRALSLAKAEATSVDINNEQFRLKIKEALSLPGVVTEVDNLSQTLNATVLMNDSFKVENFRQTLLGKSYAIVHIASHYISGATADSSFIMAYDNVIRFNQLEGLLKNSKFANQPVEMLTLSACQTAEGDDRAPLGLSGLAIKANVRSALGTLWPASDEAAALLMTEFYKALSQPQASKAQALRKAQLNLLANSKLSHPFFWAPYILVGNWI